MADKEINYLDEIRKSIGHKTEMIENIKGEYFKELKWKEEHKETEQVIYNTLKTIAQGKSYVTLDDIDSLGLPYHVLFIVSVKNVGKTTNILYNRFNYYRDRNQKVIFMRVSLNEIDKSMIGYNQDAMKRDLNRIKGLKEEQLNPYIIKKKKNTYQLFDFESGEEAGICLDFRNPNIIGGGNYPDYGAVIFDEALSWDTKNIITEKNVDAFDAFVSSIVRDKKDFKIYMMGNLRDTNNAILEGYGIQRDDQLRYINRGTEENPCYVLYININDIYESGIHSQGGVVQQMSPASKAKLYKNKLTSTSINVIEPKVYDSLKEDVSFIFIYKHEEYICTIKRPEEEETYLIALRCQKFAPYLPLTGLIYSANEMIASKYKNVSYSKCVKGYVGEIFRAVKAENAYYYCDISLMLCTALIEEYKKTVEILW